jgi:hypothetical protein
MDWKHCRGMWTVSGPASGTRTNRLLDEMRQYRYRQCLVELRSFRFGVMEANDSSIDL